MNYQTIHDSIIDRAKNHHVQPKSMGGSDDKSNLVDLTAKEHFIIHKLLVEIYPESDSMKRAIWCMSNLNNAMGRNYRVCAAEYERFKILVAEVNSKTMSGEGNPMFGRTPYQIWLEELGKEEADRLHEEKRIKRSITMKEKGIAPEHMAKIIEANKNKVYTDEDRQKMSERTSGENNPMFGRTGELNSMYGNHFYKIWVEELGKDEADRKLDEINKIKSSKMSGEGNPMFGRTPYQIWIEELGKEEADRREKEINKKRSISGNGNKNAKMVRVKCTETDVIYESITEAAKAIGMKHPTLHSWLNNPHRNKTTLVLI